jgi:hypothetical protein
MPILAVAFHEQLAGRKLRELYASPQAGAETKQSVIFCTKCLTEFAAVLMDRNDGQNTNRLENLATAIREDCINGIHRDEYVLNAEE